MWFLILLTKSNRLAEAFTDLTSIGVVWFVDQLLTSLASVSSYLDFRKAPDKYFDVCGVVIQIRRRRNRLLFLFGQLLLLSALWCVNTRYHVHSPEPESPCVTSFPDCYSVLHALSAGTPSSANQDDAPRDAGNWDSDEAEIVVDSGTSRTITPFLSDLSDARPHRCRLSGIGSGWITHVGTVRWPVRDMNGQLVTIEDSEAYYCKQAPYRLLCPHSWRQTMNNKRYSSGETEGDGATLLLHPDDDAGYILSWNRGRTVVNAPLKASTNLPTIRTEGTFHNYCSFVAAFPHALSQTIIPDGDDEDSAETMQLPTPAIVSDDESSDNESQTSSNTPQSAKPRKVQFQVNKAKQQEDLDKPLTARDEALFMSWHLKLQHAPFEKLRWAAELGILPAKLKRCRNIVCPACLYGKQRRRPWRTKGQQRSPIKPATNPGDCVSIDQMISSTPGLMAQTTGRLTKQRFYVATIFVDHYSDLDYVHLQATTSADDTIEAKQAFESFAAERGVMVKHYHADNGIFASKAFRQEVADSKQTLTFCGVGAHHQNGICEKRIQDLCGSARSALAYASHRNPAVTAELWPYALRHASYVRRILPKKGHSKSPDELFSKSGVRPTTRFLHAFGCPVYVLKAALQSGSPHSKWDDRSRVGVYLGHSKQHASNVSLILNPITGHISPQFHCVFDDNFDSIKNDSRHAAIWAKKANMPSANESTEFEDTLNDYARTTIPPSLQVPFVSNPRVEENTAETISEQLEPMQELEGAPNSDNTEFEGAAISDSMETEGAAISDSMETEGAAISENTPVAESDRGNLTRTGRRINPTRRLQESPLFQQLQSFVATTCDVLTTLDDEALTMLATQIMAFPASIADNDTMYLHQALKEDDRDEFIKAMIKEIEDHTVRGHWRVTTRDEMKQRGYDFKPIPAIWSFKRKRNPFGEITKYKARLCCHGGRTVQGVHYHETFSPVVAWSTVRMLLSLSEIYGWHARQIDFVLAFPQADVKTDVYMQVPEKFRAKNGKLMLDVNAPHPSKQDAVVKLIKNVYGLKDASKTWADYISKGLIDYGFVQSTVDPCLFVKGDMLFCLYVDDAICLTPNKADADKLIVELKNMGYTLTDEGPLSAYLGIQVERLPGNKISMSQPALIERIIVQCNLKDQRMHDTPADVILHRDEDGEPRKTEFHYRSIIGQLNYLAGTTRPEIQFAVHQCARFCENPKMSHEKAVKRIVRYLKRTPDKGLLMSVDTTKGIECYVDADFAGGFRKEKPTNPRDCLSRTGYVVKYAGCPILWSSKLQTTIALSTTEAEYMALSTAAREVIYLINLCDELRTHGVSLLTAQPTIQCRVFEDNSGAIELAKLPKLRPRTKHLAIQYHHFRTWTVRGLNDEEPRITVEYITTTNQEADIMTKPLPRVSFQHLRKRLCGW